MLEDSLEISILFDFYGPLLSDRQQEFIRLYYDENLSLTEIAESFGVSKQAVSSGIKSAEKKLKFYEEKLALVARWKRENGI